MVEPTNQNKQNSEDRSSPAQKHGASETEHLDSLFSGQQISAALGRLEKDLQPQTLRRIQGVLGHSAESAPLIESFWGKLIRYHQFGYTLFGSKPVSSGELLGEGFTNANEEERRINEKFFVTLDEQHAWQDLSGYLFPSKFLLVATNTPDQIGRCELNLVNKEALRLIVSDAQEYFAPVLGRQPAEALIDRLAQKLPLYQALEGRLDLTGIILGYGKNNSLLYQRREELNRDKSAGRIHEVFASPGFTTAQQELERINDLLLPQVPAGASSVHPVRFNGLNGYPETSKLRAYYSGMQGALDRWINSSNMVLERILVRFISELDET